MNDYWQKACALEAADQIDAAIEVLRTEMPGEASRHWECQTSYLFQLRAQRLADCGRMDEAKQAAHASVKWIHQYANSADNVGDAGNFRAQALQTEQLLKKYL
jgi:hypothetical protein